MLLPQSKTFLRTNKFLVQTLTSLNILLRCLTYLLAILLMFSQICFAGGALMDLGIYPIYAAVRLFGKPTHATYQAQKLDNSIDLNGDGMLYYPNYQVHIKAGKEYHF